LTIKIAINFELSFVQNNIFKQNSLNSPLAVLYKNPVTKLYRYFILVLVVCEFHACIFYIAKSGAEDIAIQLKICILWDS